MPIPPSRPNHGTRHNWLQLQAPGALSAGTQSLIILRQPAHSTDDEPDCNDDGERHCDTHYRHGRSSSMEHDRRRSERGIDANQGPSVAFPPPWRTIVVRHRLEEIANSRNVHRAAGLARLNELMKGTSYSYASPPKRRFVGHCCFCPSSFCWGSG
jgi:hypothetical protein